MNVAGLRSDTVRPEVITACDRGAMYRLMAAAYDHVSRERFESDLREKDTVLLLRDGSTGEIRGFSTQAVYQVEHEGRPVRVIFSGDTIVAAEFRGSQELVRAWLRFAGAVLARESGVPLYWFLISKGYRTYLYLPIFFREFLPGPNARADIFPDTLRHRLASDRFGADYDARCGVVRFSERVGNLNPAEAMVPLRRRDDPDVRYFLQCNPGFARGDELVCLAQVSFTNMRGFARALLAEGFASAGGGR